MSNYTESNVLRLYGELLLNFPKNPQLYYKELGCYILYSTQLKFNNSICIAELLLQLRLDCFLL